MKRWGRRLLFALGMFLLFVGVAWYFASLFEPVSSVGQTVVVDIPRNSTAGDIGEILEKKKLVRSRHAFHLMARVLGESRNMKAGEYEIQRNLGPIEIIDHLVKGNAIAKFVTVPEGASVNRIATLLEQQNLAQRKAFFAAVQAPPSRYRLSEKVRWGNTAGLLFPDTYKFPRDATATDIVQDMVDNFKKKVYTPHAQEFRKADLPFDKIIVVASMIEREARVPQDRPLISAVIRNRLRREMKLQIDATVIYALGYHKDIVTFKDLKVDSPYNTYKYRGLPPGPICNPGVESILAALNPAKEDYLFYVARPDGSHIFTRTGEEHNAAVRQAREERERAKASQRAEG